MLSFTSPVYSNSVNLPSRERAREILLNAYYASRKLAFDYAPLKHSQVIALASKAAGSNFKSAGDFAKLTASLKAAQLESEFASMVEAAAKPVALGADGVEVNAKKEKGTPVEFAFSLYFNTLLEKLFPPLKIPVQASKVTDVRLVANFGGWTAIRKVSIERQERKEVVACCASVFESVRKKLPEFLCQPGKESEYNSLVEAFLSNFPDRRSFARISEIFYAVEKEESKVASFAEKSLEKVLLDLFYCRALAQVGFPPFVSIDQVSRIYPELKIPKPRGRIAGAGKKKR